MILYGVFMLHFQYSSLINAPVDVVWNFHARSDILELLTPPWQPVEIIRREGGLEVGARSEFLLSLGPVSVPWVAVHTECIPHQLFTDEQQQGPMAIWVHRHQFSEVNNHTRLTDAIAFSLPGGSLFDKGLSWWVYSRLQDMFRYRHDITKVECENYAKYG